MKYLKDCVNISVLNPKKSKKEAQKDEKSQNLCRSREKKATILKNNVQAKKLALLSILRTDIKYENI